MSTREKLRAERVREFKALESAPPPTLGEPGEFAAEARRQAGILLKIRRGMARGEWTPAALAGARKPRKARRGSTGPS